jgi:hypothetical protein
LKDANGERFGVTHPWDEWPLAGIARVTLKPSRQYDE